MMHARRAAERENPGGKPAQRHRSAWRALMIAIVSVSSSVSLLVGVAGVADADPGQQHGEGAAAGASSGAAPAERLPMHDVLLARAFRLLFETTVEHVDLEELRANGIEKLRAKEEADYRRQLNKIFDDLESVDVKEVLGVTRTSSRDDVIRVLQQVDEAALIGAMNAIPDASIANLIQRKLREKGASSLADVQDVLRTELTEFVDGLSG